MVRTNIRSRKDRRKEERRARKNKATKRHQVRTNEDKDDTNPALEPQVKKSKKEKASNHKNESRPTDVYEHLDPENAAAMRRDDAEIQELESKLGLGDQKEKRRLHREYAKMEGYGDDFGDFLDDLDHLANRISGDVPYKEKEAFHSDAEQFGDVDSDSSSDESVPMKDYSAEDLADDQNHGSDSDDDDDESLERTSEKDSSDGEPSSGDEEQDHDVKDTYQPAQGEDIYGHKTELSSGVITKYVPPHLRKAQENDDRAETLKKMERSANSLFNRLSEDTVVSVAQSVAKLYPSHPTSDLNDCLWRNLKNICVAKPFVMSGLVPVYVGCVSGIHVLMGDQVQLAGHLLEHAVNHLWGELSFCRNKCEDNAISHEDDSISKEACNLILVICYLYNFGIIHCTLMYDIVRDLIKHFSEVDVELLLLILSHCGHSLRSDDPLALKEIVLQVQKRKSHTQKETDSGAKTGSSRVQYMIDAMTDLKNNKRRKQDASYNEKTAKLRKQLGRIKSIASTNGIVRTSDSCLRITLEDVLNVQTQGRWWKVGASWVGNQYKHREDDEEGIKGNKKKSIQGENQRVVPLPEFNEKLLQLASKLRMNTDVRRSIFCIIMGSEDCDDCFEKLIRAKMLKNRTERDTVRVLLECCGNEKTYNPFYSHLASRICDYQPQCKFSLQLAFWDIFKQFETIKMRKAANLAKLLHHLVAREHALKLSMLKVIDMSPEEMPESATIFLTIFFSNLFEEFDDPLDVKMLFDKGIPRPGSLPMGQEVSEDAQDGGEGLRESLSIFFLQTLKSSPKNKSKSNFRANLKIAIKACETDGLDAMVPL